ncbi:MAG TPA: potassium-transporting ATPase subunit KdpC [Thermoanaerobaculia bacterium]|jgi:K+-transporting ATPase ATPase C chain|nr:potassium-transporting ATPase subunit KdpC [Thermoanaerobaculia bacterium]
MLKEIKRGVLFTLVTMVLFGGGYHLLVWSIGRVVFPRQAEGSLVRRADGTVVGSSLIAQNFVEPRYFHPRPSAVDYNAASTGGSNYGPSNPDHLKLVRERLDARTAGEDTPAANVPSEMITASGAGLDPHIPPDAAELQVARVARTRNADPARIRDLVRKHTDGPTFGVFGRSRVNVLELNLALDASSALLHAHGEKVPKADEGSRSEQGASPHPALRAPLSPQSGERVTRGTAR